MKKIGEIIPTLKTEPKVGTKKPAPHELSEASNMIEEAGLFSKKYGRTYWLGLMKRADVSYSDMFGILKEIKSMPSKFSKGGRLTNILLARAKARKEHGKVPTA